MICYATVTHGYGYALTVFRYRKFKDGIGKLLAIVGQKFKRIGKQIFSAEIGEQLTHGDFSGLGFDENKFLIGSILLSIQFGDFVESCRSLNRHSIDVFVNRPPKMSRFENYECVIEISGNIFFIS